MNAIVNSWKHFPRAAINFINSQYFVRQYAHLADYNIKWVRPEKIASIRPEKSGDLGLSYDIKPSDLVTKYEQSKELEDADENVRRILSLEFQTRSQIMGLRKKKTIDLVKRHKYDTSSAEAKLASMTSQILQLQEYMVKNPRDRKTKVYLKELIDKRNRHIGLLRKWDYKRYEWILEKLNLFYKPRATLSITVHRKESLRKLTEKYCNKIKEEKFDTLKAQFREQQKVFFKEKLENLAFIRKEELELGIEPTVTEDDIEKTRKKIEELFKEQTS